VTGDPGAPGPASAARQRLVPGEPGDGGYRRLAATDGEQHAVRDDLDGTGLPPACRPPPGRCW
jgi:hypothetical protein